MAMDPKQWWTTMREFWRETKGEMKKVAWPGQHEVVNTTITVLVATIFFGVFLWACDLVFYRGIDLIFTQFGSRI